MSGLPIQQNVRPKLLAISSGGGHWVQLLRLQPAFVDCFVVFATVRDGYREDVPDSKFHVIPDSNRSDKIGLLKTAMAVLMLLFRERPDVVVSTGAAPGFFAVRFAGMFGARTIWVDSIANAEELSLSGQKVGRCADLWLTQWPHLSVSTGHGPKWIGNVLG